MSHSMVRRRPVRARPASDRGPAAVPRALVRGGATRGARIGAATGFRRRSVLAALVAYVLVGAFIGLATWKLTETAVETVQSPWIAAAPPRDEPRVAAVQAPAPAPRGPTRTRPC